MESIKFIDLTREIREDSRGFSFYPLKGRALEPGRLPEDFHLVSIAPGQVRGNHLHRTLGVALSLPRHRLLHVGDPPRRFAGTDGVRPPPPHLHSSRSGPRHTQSWPGAPLSLGLAGRKNRLHRRHRAVSAGIVVLWMEGQEAEISARPLASFSASATPSPQLPGVREGRGGST
jgi:hypothetical protein